MIIAQEMDTCELCGETLVGDKALNEHMREHARQRVGPVKVPDTVPEKSPEQA